MTTKTKKPLGELLLRGQTPRIFSFTEKNLAEGLARDQIASTYSRQNYMFLDLHGVTDILDTSQIQRLKVLNDTNTTVVFVSFVGHTTSMRIFARNHVQSLVDQGVGTIGGLVFSRKSGNKKPTKDGKHRRCLIDGSKYWFINNLVQHIKRQTPEGERDQLRFTFLDDNIDHVYAVDEIEGMESRLFQGTPEELIEKLEKWSHPRPLFKKRASDSNMDQ